MSDPRSSSMGTAVSAFGLAISSELALPGDHAPYRARHDLSIRFGGIPGHESQRHGRQCVCRHASADEAVFDWPDIGSFAMRQGRELVISGTPTASGDQWRLFVLGPGIASILYQRQCVVLHGSAVAIQGRGAAFLAVSGGGKSTLAAYLNRRGHRHLTDDVTAIRAGAMPLLLPGFPHARLWPDSLAHLGLASSGLPRLHPELEKRALIPERASMRNPVPLSRVFMLEDGAELRCAAIAPREAFMLLMRHSFAAQLGDQLAPSAWHFHACAHLARTIRMMRLVRPRSFMHLPRLADLIEEMIAGDELHPASTTSTVSAPWAEERKC